MNLDVDRFLNGYGMGGIALIGLLAFGVAGLGSGSMETSETLHGVDATVYKSPNCGCCGAWAQYAQRQGIM